MNQSVSVPPTGNEGCSPCSGGHASHSCEPVYRPNVDIVDTPDAVLLTADVPGADDQTVDITLENHILSIKARVMPPQFAGYDLPRPEYGVGNYERTFTLSQDIDRSAIDAVVKDGVLRVRLPKVKEAAARKVRVSGG